MTPAPLTWFVGLQLLLIAAGKWRARSNGEPTLVNTVLPLVPPPAFWAADGAVLVLLLTDRTSRLGALALIVMVGAGVVLEVAFSARDLPCGCFGAAHPSRRNRPRERLARAVLGLEALVLAVHPVTWPAPAQLGAGVLLSGALIALLPGLVTVWSREPAITPRAATRLLAAGRDLDPWRPYLLSDIPASVRVTGRRTADVVLDAWRDDGPLLLLVRIRGRRVGIRARDGQTLEPVAAL